MKLIDKELIIDKLENEIKECNKKYDIAEENNLYNILKTYELIAAQYSNLISFINSIGTKEVDVDELSRKYLLHEHISPLTEIFHKADLKAEMQYHKDIENAYKAGFKEAMKTTNI